MGSKAPRATAIPGPPTLTELAYLAGLIDRGGGFTTSPAGLKIRAPREQADWLMDRFGGCWYPMTGTEDVGTWWLRKQAELYDTLRRVLPFVIRRCRQVRLMQQYVEHIRDRASYHGETDWRAQREELAMRIRAHGVHA